MTIRPCRPLLEHHKIVTRLPALLILAAEVTIEACIHARAWRWARRCGRRLPPRPPHQRACLAEPRACAASQWGGVMSVGGSSTITVTISGGAISGCSAVAGRNGAVRARHAAQRGPSLEGREAGQGVAEEGGRLRGLLHPCR